MKRLFYCLILLGGFHILQSQEMSVFQRAAQFIKLGEEDGSSLTLAYLEPVVFRLIEGQHSFLYTPFRKERKFSLFFGSSYVHVSMLSRRVNIPSLRLKYMEHEDIYGEDLETVYGNQVDLRLVSKLKDTLGYPAYVFDTPYAIGYKKAPLYLISLSYSVTGTTNISGGFSMTTSSPYSEYAGFSFQGYHIGIQQDLMPLFNLSESNFTLLVNGKYAYMQTPSGSVRVEPGLPHINAAVIGRHNGPYDNQQLEVRLQSWSISTYAGYRLTPITRLYAGGGYVGGTNVLRFKGIFPAYRPDSSGAFAVERYDLSNPLIRRGYGLYWGELGTYVEGERLTFQAQFSYGKYPGMQISVGYKFDFKLENPDLK